MRNAKCGIGFISLALHSQGIVKCEIKCLRHAIKFPFGNALKHPLGAQASLHFVSFTRNSVR